ncbi:hypothetical protein ABFY57_00225 [Paenibacillus polymyxa]|uniref:hypothetical protein n=1 Tax=Paenibacillus polymyxa TaxID=1406 RepID=UPI003D28DDC6
MNKMWFIAAGLCIVIGVAGMVVYGAPWNQQVMKETTAINKKWTFTRGQLQNLKVDSSDDVSILFTSWLWRPRYDTHQRRSSDKSSRPDS